MRPLWLCLSVFLSAATACADDYKLDAQGFIHDWLIGGPYPSYWVNGTPRGFSDDFLTSLGGEANAEPRAGFSQEVEFVADKAKLIAGIGSTNEWGYTQTKRVQAVWKTLHSAPARISLGESFAPFKEHLAAYALCYVVSPDRKRIRVRVGSDDDHKLFLNGVRIGSVNAAQDGTAPKFVYEAELQPGLNRLMLKVVNRTREFGYCVALADMQNAPLRDVTIRLEAPQGKPAVERPPKPVDRAKLDAQTRAIQAEIANQERALAAARAEAVRLAGETEALGRRRTELYGAIEAAYSTRRSKLTSNPRPVDEPILRAEVARSRRCLNGDQWLMGAGDSPMEKDEGHTPPDPKSMTPGVLPMIGMNKYFRTWYYPVSLRDPKNPYGKLKPHPGWEQYAFNPLVCAKRLWLRTQIELAAKTAENACTLLCDHVNGTLRAYLNGQYCGQYSGNIGLVEIPLKAARPGGNTLELFVAAPEEPISQFRDYWGILGDVSLEIASPVNVASATVRTSWRNATLAIATEVKNRSPGASNIRLEQYCVLDGRVKYRLPAQQSQLSAGARVTIEDSGRWLEARTWGIGGAYGPPVLYDLVSDLYADGRLVDRRVTPFGFREFWVAGSDFYLNGKRIILQGDVGFESKTAGLANRRSSEVIFSLLRADGINTIRSHDSNYWSPAFLRLCDQVGMLAYVQMYPILHEKRPLGNFTSGVQTYLSYDEWLKHPLHERNLENYARWVRMLANHPSVAIASTDNEIFTQAWDTLEKLDFNLRNDRLGAFYERYVKSLEPSLVMTRDGDEGTWGRKGKWQEEPPCDTANYHYPDFVLDEFVTNWPTVYGFRPALFGETLYHAYGAWDDWIGALPSQVHKKALKVRQVASRYRSEAVPGQIYMGLVLDGFIRFDASGEGNPWRITEAMHNDCLNRGVPIAAVPGYPWARVPWPSLSGPGLKLPATRINVKLSGIHAINWYDAGRPTHVRNEVNDAYRDSLLPQPPLATPRDTECLVELGPAGAGRLVRISALDSLGGHFEQVADNAGTAWLDLPRPGKFRVECGDGAAEVEIAGRGARSAQPGFAQIPRVKLNVHGEAPP